MQGKTIRCVVSRNTSLWFSLVQSEPVGSLKLYNFQFAVVCVVNWTSHSSVTSLSDDMDKLQFWHHGYMSMSPCSEVLSHIVYHAWHFNLGGIHHVMARSQDPLVLIPLQHATVLLSGKTKMKSTNLHSCGIVHEHSWLLNKGRKILTNSVVLSVTSMSNGEVFWGENEKKLKFSILKEKLSTTALHNSKCKMLLDKQKS